MAFEVDGSNKPPGVTGVAATTAAGTAPAVEQAKKILSKAMEPVTAGFHEGPNNDNPYTQRVMGDRHQPWCAAFTSCNLADAGIKGYWSASAPALQQQCKPTNDPRPGDLVFFGNPAHHVGHVAAIKDAPPPFAGKAVYTIEGNTSDAALMRWYQCDQNGNAPGLSYGRVLNGTVPKDIGIDTSMAKRGGANAPGVQARGAGTAGSALSNGVDANAYFPSGPNLQKLQLALLMAMLKGDWAAVAELLHQMLPMVSDEDIQSLAGMLKDHPELMERIAMQPEILQGLAGLASTPASMRPAMLNRAIQQLLSQPPTAPVENGVNVLRSLLGTRQLDYQKLKDTFGLLMPLADPAGAGWGGSRNRALGGGGLGNGGWGPPIR
nr:hypothetical protein Hi04_10k_c3807_00026 [uncultured bacterium]